MSTEKAAPARRKPRADSLRNRDALLEAATSVFAAGGATASLEEVARRAGVGIGTLYRHFPRREDLFEAVYRAEVDRLEELAVELDATPDPLAALRAWVQAMMGFIATKRGMSAALEVAMHAKSPGVSETTAKLTAALHRLLASGTAAGALRADISAGEVLRALVGLCYLNDQPGWQDSAARLLDVFVDGLARRDAA